MNIPPQNDLNRGPSYSQALKDFFVSVVEQHGQWTSAHDLAVRFAVPVFGMAAVAMYRHMLSKKETELNKQEEILKLSQQQLAYERKKFEEHKDGLYDQSLVNTINDMMASANQLSYRATKEVESIRPLIQEVLRIRCSPIQGHDKREPIEKEIRQRILHNPSPLDLFGSLRKKMHEDILEIYKKDIQHCDSVWPLGNHNNGELYKVYMDNWKLYIELEKHKQIIEHLKRKSLNRKT